MLKVIPNTGRHRKKLKTYQLTKAKKTETIAIARVVLCGNCFVVGVAFCNVLVQIL